jgi:hypothetical protein
MQLTKQNLNINFSQGLDTKTDPNQVSAGKFLNLQNSIFTKGGLLQKRNGYKQLTASPSSNASYLTTFNGDLTAIGTQLDAYSSGYQQWVNRGNVRPATLDVMPLIRNNTNQSQSDTAVSPNNLICTVYTDQDPSNLNNHIYKYAVADVTNGQNIIAPTVLSADATYGTPRVFLLGNYFVIVYTYRTGGTYYLNYVAVSTVNPTQVSAPTSISSNYTPATTVAWDGYVFNNSLYLAWNGASSTGIQAAYLTSQLALSSTFNPDASHQGTVFSVTADAVNSVIWVSYFDAGTNNLYTLGRSPQLNPVRAPTLVNSTDVILNLTSVAASGVLHVYYELSNNYSYNSAIPSHLLRSRTVTQAGTVGSAVTVLRSVGLASKAFVIDGTTYFLAVYQSPYQTTYLLTNASGNIISVLAYGNGGGYLTFGLPSVAVNGVQAQLSYLIKDQIQSVNKNTAIPAGNQTAGIFSQFGVNLVNFQIQTNGIVTAEIGNNLNITGGLLWAYDGYAAVEQEFFLYPDSVKAVWSATGGSIVAKPDGSTNTNAYYYVVTYEWTDNQGNAFRSAPSIPVAVTTTGAGSAGSVTINAPSLRLTYKTANPVKIVIYRWSVAQQNYYQVTSIATPLLNDVTVDSVSYVDTLADATILGNNLLYTTGGVLENIGPPAFSSTFIFDDRLWGIKSEDPNLLWFSKQVLEAAPVEFSDLLTIYVAPNIGAQGSTGPLTCGAAMDDKLILFKASAINFINGTGPDNTGANSQYSQPVFVTSTVGCSNQASIIFQPQGLMFEFASEAGNQIWLLGRDLSSQYIGAPVERYTLNATVESAVNIPGTNEVRFTMSNGVTLMYDYYYGQWGTFANVPAVSSTLYQGVQAFINSYGQVFQETPGQYLDGANPVLMSFTTSWLNFAGLQGYQRAYFFYLLATYLTPHKLVLNIAYDYNSNAVQQSIITPTNFSPAYGNDLTYGSGNPYGGSGSVEPWRVFLARDRCQAFQITLTEVYDPTYGVAAGAGFTMSGINVVAGIKKGYRPIRAVHSVG